MDVGILSQLISVQVKENGCKGGYDMEEAGNV